MKMLKTALCLSVPAFILCMGSSNAAAYDTSPDKHTLHIHTPELKSAPSYQLASITWLPDYDANEKIWGKYIITGGGGHPRGDGCDSKFNLSECPANGDCDDCPTNRNKIYFKGCKSGYKAEPAGSQNCVLDCIPNSCDGYTLTSQSDANAEYESCEVGCNLADKYKFIKCKAGYFLESGQCVACEKTQQEGSCPDGTRFNEGTACENASGVKVGDCEDCLETDCKGRFSCDGEYQNGEGTTCVCGNKTYYEYCTDCNKENTSCPEGYELENECKRNGTTYGDCIDCLDENATKNPCKGLYTCRGGGRLPKGESTCTCGSIPYYKECLVEETCKYGSDGYSNYIYYDENNKSAGKCFVTAKDKNFESYWIESLDYYLVKSLCTKVDGTEMVAIQSCDASGKDCNGNDAPAKGMIECPFGMAIRNDGGQVVDCGGMSYGTSCLAKCNYEFKEEDCTAQGKTFERKCHDNDDIWWGECK